MLLTKFRSTHLHRQGSWHAEALEDKETTWQIQVSLTVLEIQSASKGFCRQQASRWLTPGMVCVCSMSSSILKLWIWQNQNHILPSTFSLNF